MEAAKRYSLADTFDLTHFKDYQTRIIDAVIEKRDTLVVQPTGSGKSLCFQFPAVYTRKLSLVVSPTISLMQDQTLQLQARGISAMYLGSAQMDPQAESKVFSPDLASYPGPSARAREKKEGPGIHCLRMRQLH